MPTTNPSMPNPSTPNASPVADNQPLIRARSVAWALSSAALFCLAAGVLTLHSLGSLGGAAHLESEPEQILSQPKVSKPDHPTVLSPSRNMPTASVDGFNGYDSLFPTPSAIESQNGSAPRPATATLPSPELR